MKKSKEMEPVLFSLAQKVAVAHTAVLVIDMQNDFCSPDGVVSGRPDRDWRRVQSIIPRMRDFLDKARDEQVRIIFVKAIHDEEDISGPYRELMFRRGQKDYACKRDSWGAELDNKLEPQDIDVIVQKNRYSAFVSTDLDSLLKDWGVRTLIVTGVSTCTCVESTARDGFMRDYYIVLPRDLTASFDEDLYQATLKNIEEFFGQVVYSDEILTIWEGTNLM